MCNCERSPMVFAGVLAHCKLRHPRERHDARLIATGPPCTLDVYLMNISSCVSPRQEIPRPLREKLVQSKRRVDEELDEEPDEEVYIVKTTMWLCTCNALSRIAECKKLIYIV